MSELTTKVIDRAQVRDAVYYLWDHKIKGFVVKVTKNGSKKYFIKYVTCFGGKNGQQRWYIFGDIFTHTLKEARIEAAKLMRNVKAGDDPQKMKSIIREIETMNEFWEIFLRRYVSKKINHKLYEKRVDSLWRNLIKPRLGNVKILDITQEDIENLHLRNHHIKYNANRAVSLLHLLFNLMEKWNYRPLNSNPCRFIEKYKEEARIRYLSKEELRRFVQELKIMEVKTPERLYAISAIKLLLLTGSRKGEILTAKWDWVDFENRVILLPKSKTGQKPIYLNEQAVSILMYLRGRAEKQKSNYIIKNANHSGHLFDIKRVWYDLMKESKIENFRIHDLRHTAASIAVSEGHSLYAVASLLGHKTLKMTQRYAHLSNKAALDVADTISSIVIL